MTQQLLIGNEIVAQFRNIFNLIFTDDCALSSLSFLLIQLPPKEHGEGEQDDEHADDEHNDDDDVVKCITNVT